MLLSAIRRWVVRFRFMRDEAHLPVAWDTCVYSPRKAAEQAFVRMMTEHHVQLARLQMQAAMDKTLQQYATAAQIAMARADSLRQQIRLELIKYRSRK